MRFSILQENFKKGLFIASHITSKKINLPILNNIKIEAREKKIKLTATDLEMGVVCAIRGKVEEEGDFTVDSKIILEYVSALPNQKMQVQKKEQKLLIESAENKTAIKGMEADEFPLIPQIETEDYFSVDMEEIKKAIPQVAFAVSNSETKKEMSGVYFDFSGEKLVMAATDGFRLAEKKIELIKKGQNKAKIIIPARTLQELLRILSGQKMEAAEEAEKEIKIYLSENQIMFSHESMQLVSRLIEGYYPEYAKILPNEFQTEAAMDKTEFLRAVKISSIFSQTGINDISLDFLNEKEKAVVSSTSEKTGENRTEISAKIIGSDSGVVLNYRYLLDGINNISTENMVIKISKGNNLTVILPENDNNYLYLVMPLKQ